jgi:hypothetical protein
MYFMIPSFTRDVGAAARDRTRHPTHSPPIMNRGS